MATAGGPRTLQASVMLPPRWPVLDFEAQMQDTPASDTLHMIRQNTNMNTHVVNPPDQQSCKALLLVLCAA